jgi:ethanolamine transporter EutH
MSFNEGLDIQSHLTVGVLGVMTRAPVVSKVLSLINIPLSAYASNLGNKYQGIDIPR